MPTVKNTLVDEPNNTTYHVMAYRPLTPEEMAGAVDLYYAQRRGQRKNRAKNKQITVVSAIGHDERAGA